MNKILYTVTVITRPLLEELIKKETNVIREEKIDTIPIFRMKNKFQSVTSFEVIPNIY